VKYPPRRPRKIGLALPASLLSDVAHLRDKTIKVGFIGRACAIFRVEEVVVYKDRDDVDFKDAKLLVDLLNYMNCPQYLRKLLYPLKPELRFVGILPPLRTPNHPLESKVSELPASSFREGVVVGRRGSKVYVEVGLEEPIAVEASLKRGDRVIIHLVKRDGKVEATISSLSEVPFYFGFKAKLEWSPLVKVVKTSNYSFILATSRLGISLHEALPKLKEHLSSHSTFILFGSPKEGLAEILRREGFSLDEVANLTVNFIPHQGVETVRTEEAVLSVLSIVNWLSYPLEDRV